MTQFFGKYRGKVENNVDPQSLGRVQVSVPAVLGEGSLSWAMPCTPYAGSGVGFFALPPTGANIWVEFEAGDPDYPIWSGCFWATGELPVDPAIAEKKVLKTESVTLTLDDTSNAGGVTLEVDSPGVSTPLKMVFDSNGIQITDDETVITITPSDIEIKNGEVSFKLSSSEIELKNADVSQKLSSSEAEIKNSDVSLKLSASELELKNNTPTVKLSSSEIELSNGGGKLKVSSSGVDVNDGALEVM